MTTVDRKTKETDISVTLDIDGTGESDIQTGISFFDHMLESFSKHSLVNLSVKCEGDLHIDFHHSVEDIGIVIGQALKNEIYPFTNRERFADAIAVMDESAISTALDLSNRAYLHYEVPVFGKIGEFDTELIEEFFRALIFNASINAHIVLLRGSNKHHILEATFKSFAISLRRALKINDRITTPSTKGVL